MGGDTEERRGESTRLADSIVILAGNSIIGTNSPLHVPAVLQARRPQTPDSYRRYAS
jgi:hypothetical protein